MQRLRQSHVAVFGLGGVGSWCAEALTRAGIGHLTIVDMDTVSETNINRQCIALSSTVGREKARVMAERLRDISPALRLDVLCERYDAATRDSFFQAPYDFVVDAIDLVSCKLDLILAAKERNIPIVSALGTGNKTDASQLRLCDISETSGCPFARVIRKELRARGVEHLTVVFSPEPALCPKQVEAPPPGRRSVPGSLIWVPATAGMRMAQHVVLTLAGFSVNS